MDPATLEALNRASSLELFHLSSVIERLMSDPSRIVQIRLHLNLGQRVRFVDWKAPGAALQLRSGTVVAMKDTQVTVQDDATRVTWTLPYAAIELPADSRAASHKSLPGRFLDKPVIERLQALNGIARRRGQTLAQMAIAWTLRDPRMTSALIGASRVEQIEDCLAALKHLDFSAGELAEIDRHAVDSDMNLWAASSAH